MVESPRGPRDRKEQPGSTGQGQPLHGSPNAHTIQLLVTLDAATHEVIKLERLGGGGQRRELSAQDWAELSSSDDNMEELVDAVEEAYAAGVADGLGEEDSEDDIDDDDDLSDLLAGQPAKRSGRHGMRLALLRRLLLRQLLRRRAAEAASAPHQRRKPP